MTRFLLIRHAAIESSGKVLAGRTEGIHLSERGRQQAEALAAHLGGCPIDALHSSPLERALETAGPLAKLLGLEVASSEDFIEIAFGEWTNRPFPELAGDPLFQRIEISLASVSVVEVADTAIRILAVNSDGGVAARFDAAP